MPRGKEFRGGQYGNTRGKERKGTAAARRAQDPRYVAAMEQARADQAALNALIEEQKINPAVGPVAGAMHAAERKKAEEAAAASRAEVAKVEVAEEIAEAVATPVKPEPVVKAPKPFVAKPYGWRKKLPEFGEEDKQENFAMTTARIMAKTGYNIEHICKTTNVGWGDLDDVGEWDEDGYLIFDLGGDDGSAEGD